MRIYELALVLKPSLTGVARKKVLDAIKDSLKNLKIKEEKEVGEKELTYKIKKQTSGFFLNYVLEGDSIASDFEKKLINNENVLRHLLLRNQ